LLLSIHALSHNMKLCLQVSMLMVVWFPAM